MRFISADLSGRSHRSTSGTEVVYPKILGWNVSVRWVTFALMVLGLAMILATAYLFASLQDRRQVMLQSVREDAMWAVFQTNRQAARLTQVVLEAQNNPTPDAIDAVLLAFYLLYSRIALLDRGVFFGFFSILQ